MNKPIQNLLAILEERSILPTVIDLAPAWQDCFLVGGSVRDWLLDRPLVDFDLATAGNPTTLAKQFAEAVSGRWVSLDETFCQSRVVWRDQETTLWCDFAPLRASKLAGDLAARDFTINAMALDLRDQEFGIADPLGGIGALQDRRLSLCAPDVLSADPLRCLRAVRFAATLGMKPDDELCNGIRKTAPRLADVAGERINSELAKTFSVPDQGKNLALLKQLGIWSNLFGDGLGDCDVSFLQEADRQLSNGQGLGILGEQSLGSGWNRTGVLRLALLLRTNRLSTMVKSMAGRLKWGNSLTQLVGQLCEFKLPGDFLRETQLATTRGRVQACLALGPDFVSCLMMALLLAPETSPDPNAIADFSREAVLHAPQGRLQPLVDGGWIARELGIQPGPELGRLLDELRRGEIDGRIRNRSDGEEFLRRLVVKSD
ncbi:MAG: hypothetical protein C0616_09195 [Desulfuromonas sp.]|nr:MAG: hypothetical protein C0616_09195 [Desulfuromonas sp.]